MPKTQKYGCHVTPRKHVLANCILGSQAVGTGYLATGYPPFGYPTNNIAENAADGGPGSSVNRRIRLMEQAASQPIATDAQRSGGRGQRQTNPSNGQPPNGRGSNTVPGIGAPPPTSNLGMGRMMPAPSEATHMETRTPKSVVHGRGAMANARVTTRDAWSPAPASADYVDIFDLLDELSYWVGREHARSMVIPEELIFKYIIPEMLRDAPSTCKWWIGPNYMHNAASGIPAPNSQQAAVLNAEMRFQQMDDRRLLDWSHVLMEAV